MCKTLFTTLFLTLFLTGCETAEQDALNRAQDCLDHATSSEALTCMEIVNGIESGDAYVIRCSAQFISEGITASRMADAFNKRDATDTSKSPILGMMGIFSFREASKASTTYEYCKATGLKGFATLGSMAQMSTTFTHSAGDILTTIEAGETPTQQQMEDALDTILSRPDEENEAIYTTVGETATTTYASHCEDPANANSEICIKVSASIDSGSTSAEIGKELLILFQTSGSTIPQQ